MASGDAVQQIKDRLSVVDVVSSYVQLHQAGKNFKGKSPFTNEKTPSFYVSPDRGMYYCFSSSQGGDIFTFVQAMEGVDFKGALKILADKAGIELVPEDPKKKTERDRQYDVLETATAFFEESFSKEIEAQKYIEARGVTPETRAKWRIGYAPGPPHHGWRDTKAYLQEKQFTEDELVKTGLIKGLETGKEAYDVFRDRIMFPIFDGAGKVVAYSGRILAKDTEAPKYVNSPETAFFNKSEILYGYDKAKQGIRSMDFSLIVEGQFDVVLAHQAGYTNTVAVSGTALTAYHVMLLQRLSNRVVLALDADRAGIAAVKRAADLMLSRSMDVKVAKMPNGEDPADMIQKNPASFKEAIKKASHVIEYLLDVLESDKKDDRTFKLRAHDEILPYIIKIPNRIDQEHFETVVAKRLGSTKEAIHAEVLKLQQKASDVQTDNEPSTVSVSVIDEDKLDSYAQQVFGALAYIERFTQEAHIYANIYAKLKSVLDEQFDTVFKQMDGARLNKTIMQFEKTYQAFPHKEFFDHLASKMNIYCEMYLKKELAEQKEVLQSLEASKDGGENFENVLKRIDTINRKLQNMIITDEEIMAKKD